MVFRTPISRKLTGRRLDCWAPRFSGTQWSPVSMCPGWAVITSTNTFSASNWQLRTQLKKNFKQRRITALPDCQKAMCTRTCTLYSLIGSISLFNGFDLFLFLFFCCTIDVHTSWRKYVQSTKIHNHTQTKTHLQRIIYLFHWLFINIWNGNRKCEKWNTVRCTWVGRLAPSTKLKKNCFHFKYPLFFPFFWGGGGVLCLFVFPCVLWK